ncbi:MAG: gamma-glutamyltransferase family protein, partial [Zetaproteobacteria bacterium]
PQSNGIGGEVPTLIYSATENKAYAISGVGWNAEAFTIDWCREHGIDLVPGDGYLPACVPAPVDTWATALARFGTLRFADVLQPAIELAEHGFPVYEGLHEHLSANREKYLTRYPTTGELYLPGGRVPEVGTVWRNPDWANVLKRLCQAEAAAANKGRVAGIEAARDAFYVGDVAARIVDFIASHPVEDASGSAHAGLLSRTDLAEWRASVEEPVSLAWGDLTVHKCPAWTQGPVFLQQMALVIGDDLKALGHNTADYLHLLIESAKLAFADREAYYGDPRFDTVPLDVLLSPAYTAKRRALIGAEACPHFRPGDVGHGVPPYATFNIQEDNRRALQVTGRSVRDLGLGHSHVGDTTHLDAVDRQGNMVAATPSGGWLADSPVIPGLGFPLGSRGQMFYLNAARPNALAPRKRPRATLTPSLVTRGGKPFMVFGTPGGDGQDQWTLQFFLNHLVFGMNLQEALDAPTVTCVHFPSSFYPRPAYPNRVEAEGRLDPAVLKGLEKRGHEIKAIDGWANGKVMGVRFDEAQGVIAGGVSPRRAIGYALGW